MKKQIAIIAASSLTAALLFLAGTRFARQASARSPAPIMSVSQSEADQDEVRARAELYRAFAAVAVQPTPEIAAAPPSPPPQPSTAAAVEPAPSQETADEEARRAEQTVRTFYDRQRADSPWARSAQLQIQALYEATGLPRASLLSVECREATCRAELAASKDVDAARVFRAMGTGEKPWMGPIAAFTQTEPGGKSTVLVYLVQQGKLLPDLSQPAEPP